MKQLLLLFLALITLFGSGCEIRRRMYDQPKFEPLEKTDLFGDNSSARPLIEGTVARGELRLDDHYYVGLLPDAKGELGPVSEYPAQIKEQLGVEALERGRERYDIFCSVCHGLTGKGDGMVVLRGYPAAKNLHDPGMDLMPPGYFYQIITHGRGNMQGYADQISVEDRWLIAAYIKALQLSQNAVTATLPAADQDALKNDTNHEPK
jgi:mono/diheme cytochrome c family protein